MEKKIDVNLAVFDFKDISEDSPESDKICKVLANAASKLAGEEVVTDHWYNDGDGLIWEGSYETDEYECVNVIANLKEVGSKIFQIRILEDSILRDEED